MQELPGPKSKRLRRAAFTRTVVARKVADLKIDGLQQRHSILFVKYACRCRRNEQIFIQRDVVGRITGGLGSVKKPAATGRIIIRNSKVGLDLCSRAPELPTGGM